MDDERPSEGTAVQVSAATLLRGGAEQGEEPGRNPGPPSRDTGERGTALGRRGALTSLSRKASQKAKRGGHTQSKSLIDCTV